MTPKTKTEVREVLEAAKRHATDSDCACMTRSQCDATIRHHISAALASLAAAPEAESEPAINEIFWRGGERWIRGREAASGIVVERRLLELAPHLESQWRAEHGYPAFLTPEPVAPSGEAKCGPACSEADGGCYHAAPEPAAPSGEEICGICGNLRRKHKWGPDGWICPKEAPAQTPEAAQAPTREELATEVLKFRDAADAALAAKDAELAKVRRQLLDIHDARQAECDGTADLPAEIRSLRARLEEAERESEQHECIDYEHAYAAGYAKREHETKAEKDRAAAAETKLDAAWKAAGVPVRGMVDLAEVIADWKEKLGDADAAERHIEDVVSMIAAMGPFDGFSREALIGVIARIEAALSAAPGETGVGA